MATSGSKKVIYAALDPSLGRKVAVQGNLDPCALFLPEKEIRYQSLPHQQQSCFPTSQIGPVHVRWTRLPGRPQRRMSQKQTIMIKFESA